MAAKIEMRKKNKKKIASTQKYLPIKEIRQDVIIMRDGTLRRILGVSSINFALKNEDEQQAIINGYVQFLNTLEYPVQIVIQSRKLDIQPYIKKLRKLAKIQVNELLKIQTTEYTNYIEELVELAQIMEKRFYVVVPYSPFSSKAGQKGFFTRLQEVLSPAKIIKLNHEKFKKYKENLDRRSGIVASGLTSIGLKVKALDTQSLIELYYQIYNPSNAQQKKVGSVHDLLIEDTKYV